MVRVHRTTRPTRVPMVDGEEERDHFGSRRHPPIDARADVLQPLY